MKKKLLVVHAGGLFNSDINKSYKEFARVTNTYETYIYGILVMDSALNMFGNSIVNNYKLGKIESDSFLTLLRYRLWLSNNFDLDSLKDAWNAMCKFDQVAKDNCNVLYKKLSADQNIECLVIANTNEMHFQYNQAQLKETLGKKRYDEIKGRITFQNSHDHGTFSFQELFEKAIVDTTECSEIISLVYGVDYNQFMPITITDLSSAVVDYNKSLRMVPTTDVNKPIHTALGEFDKSVTRD